MVDMLVFGAMIAIIVIGFSFHQRARRAERLLEESEERLDDLRRSIAAATHERALFLEILSGLGEGLLAIDRDRRVVLANRRFAEMFGAIESLVGRSVGEVARIAAVFEAFDDALAGRESTDSFHVQIGGVDRAIQIRTFPLASDEIAAVAIFIDVTRLERLEQVRRDFVSDFSHEARTPLAALKSAVESFDVGGRPVSPDEERQLRRIMTRQLSRLERLVNDLSELSRIESGDIRLTRSTVALRPLLEGLCEDFAEPAAQKGLRLVVTGDDVSVAADAGRVEQALSNLIDNAIKYSGENAAVEIGLGLDGSSAVVTVRDHGAGIPRDQQERIFHRFFRLDRSRSEVPGAGLGLAIARHLILQHGGSIEVESTPGKGSTFIVRLPLAPQPQ